DGGPILALFEHASFPVNHDRLEPGECLVAFTDAGTDGMNTEGTMLGPERLFKAVSAMSPEDAYSLTQAVFTLVEEFARGAPQADDITVLTVRYTGRRES